MSQKSVKFLGEKLKVAFNMAVEIAYEQITGKAFDVKDLDKVSNISALYYAAIVVNNPDTKITFDDLIKKAKVSEINKLREAVFAAFSAWAEIPEVAKGDPKQEGEENDPN